MVLVCIHRIVLWLTFGEVRTLELRCLHLRELWLAIHAFMTHLLMHLSHLAALHLSVLLQEIDLPLHLGDLGVLLRESYSVRVHLSHRELHSHSWYHLRSHLRVLQWILRHNWVLHELLLVVLALNFLQLLALSLIDSLTRVGAQWATLIGCKSGIGLLELHIVGLVAGSCLLEALRMMLQVLSSNRLAMVTQVSSDFLVSKGRAVFLVWSSELIGKDPLVFVSNRLSNGFGSLLEKLLAVGSSQWVSVRVVDHVY